MTNISKNPNECRPRFLALGVDDPYHPTITRIPRRATLSASGAAWAYALCDGKGFGGQDLPPEADVEHYGGVFLDGTWQCQDVPTATDLPNCGLCQAVNSSIDLIAGEPFVLAAGNFPQMGWYSYLPSSRTLYWPGFVDAPTLSPAGTGDMTNPATKGYYIRRTDIHGACARSDGYTAYPVTSSEFSCENDLLVTGGRLGYATMTLFPDSVHPENSYIQVFATISFGGIWSGGWNSIAKNLTQPAVNYLNRFGLTVTVFRIPDSITWGSSECSGSGNTTYIIRDDSTAAPGGSVVDYPFTTSPGDWQGWQCSSENFDSPVDEDDNPYLCEVSVPHSGPSGSMTLSFSDWFEAPIIPP